MFVRYGKTAMIAAIMALCGNTVWAQSSASQPCHPATGSVKCWMFGDSSCMTGNCCKDGECCKKSEKCDAKCTCGKDDKCACCKDGECGCDKCGCKKSTCASCPLLNKLAKRTAIIMVMPASMPLPVGCCMEAMGQLPHPPLPPPHVMLPPPLPPPVPFPQMGQFNEPNYNNFTYGYRVNPNGCCVSGITAEGPVCCCTISKPAITTKIHITASPSTEQLEMRVAEGTAIHCKKMTLTIGENEITVSRYSDCVRVRGDELYATAASVCTDGKDRLILEGNAVLHDKKAGQCPSTVRGGRIELNLRSGAMTVQRFPSLPAETTPERVHGSIEP